MNITPELLHAIASEAGEAAAEKHESKLYNFKNENTGEVYGPYPACGFAWVNVKPGNSKFANWMKKNKLARKSYYGGVDIWVSLGGSQDMEKKYAYAAAYANVLVENGIRAYPDQRLD